MFNYNTIDEALDELRAGRIILVTDDDDRENEGDFICAAQFATRPRKRRSHADGGEQKGIL